MSTPQTSEDVPCRGGDERIDELIERAERLGGVRESEIERVAEQLGLGEAELEELRDRLADRHVPVEDDCGRPSDATAYANGELAHYAVDALDQFLAGATRHRLLLGREPTIEEVAAAAGVPPADVLALDQSARVVTSLDRPVGEGGDTTYGQLLPRPGPDVGEEVVLSLERQAVRQAVDALPEPDRAVIKHRFGIDGDPRPETYAAVARRLGLVSGEVRAIAELARLRELDGLSPGTWPRSEPSG